MANEITQDLVPIREELETLNETIRNRDRLNRMQWVHQENYPTLHWQDHQYQTCYKIWLKPLQQSDQDQDLDI